MDLFTIFLTAVMAGLALTGVSLLVAMVLLEGATAQLAGAVSNAARSPRSGKSPAASRARRQTQS